MGHPKSKFPTRILLYLSNIKIDEKKVTKTGKWLVSTKKEPSINPSVYYNHK